MHQHLNPVVGPDADRMRHGAHQDASDGGVHHADVVRDHLASLLASDLDAPASTP